MKKGIVERISELLQSGSDPDGVHSYLLHLARERGTLEAVLNTLREGVLLINGEAIVYMNQAAADMSGLAAGDTVAKLAKVLRGLDLAALALGESGEGERRFHRQELRLSYPEPRDLVVYVVPQAGQDGEEPLLSLVLQDVTDERSRELTQRESETLRVLTMLAAGVAHELGNPLNSLNIHLQLLKRHLAALPAAEAQEAGELLDVAAGEVQRLDTIIRQFLGAIRSSKPELRPLHLQTLLEETLIFMRPEFDERHVQVQAHVAERLPLVAGDATQIKQVFYNILKNSLQAMPGGGTLVLGCKPEGEWMRLSFADSGDGFRLDNIGRIFNSYQSDRHSGTGLGLFIVEKIVREHGGLLEITSAEGEGTILVIRLPLENRGQRLIATGPDLELGS